MSSPSGARAWRSSVDAFGVTQVDTTSTVSLSVRLPGQFFDEELGAHYNRFRYYSPEIGIYFQTDPLLTGRSNRYQYAAGSPTNVVDWLGLKLCLLHLPGLHGGDFAAVVDEAFAAALQEFVAANQSAGVDVTFDSAFRTTAGQATVAADPNSTTPATPGNSLHEAGFAADVNWSQVSSRDQATVVSNAKAAGLSWGGDFNTPDPVHFFVEVPGGIGQRSAAINAAQSERSNTLVLPDCKTPNQCTK